MTFAILTDFFFSLLIYLTTVAQIPQPIVYGIISIIGVSFFLKSFLSQKLQWEELILLLFVSITITIFVIGNIVDKPHFEYIDYERSNEIVPYSIFLIGTVFFSKKIGSNVLKILFFMILFEVGIGVIEYIYRVPYIIAPAVITEPTSGYETLLYYNKVYGLSPNTSTFGMKILVGIVLSLYLKQLRFVTFYISFLFLGLIVSFNRTAIASAAIFLISYYLYSSNIPLRYKIRTVLLASVIVSIVVSSYISDILFQVYRGSDKMDSSGRDRIFSIYIHYIKDNFILGHFSEKIYMKIRGHSYHAHNSYLQTIATVGGGSFLIFLYYLYCIIKKNTGILIYLLPFFIFSLAQYGIFWGCSMLDIVFYSIIFHKVKKTPQFNE